MGLEAKRYDYYKKTLGESLQSAAALIRTYRSTLNEQVPQLVQQANRVWELSQRHRLVAGDCSRALTTALIPLSLSLSRSLSDRLHDMLPDIGLHVADFERESYALLEELNQKNASAGGCLPAPLADWHAWLTQTLTVLQTQAKYLALHARALQPQLVQSAAVKQFQQDLRLATYYESRFCMGLAHAERRPELLPVAMAS
ncbi:hypothetical protein KR222_005294 [Zaprionus bogoriensis]|nr:hypothetical protein KR222_005294 [Zaprionus bogoriensis]